MVAVAAARRQWRQRGGSGGSLAAAEALRCQLGVVLAVAAAAWMQWQRDGVGDGGGADGGAAARRRWRRQLVCSSLALAWWRRQLGGGGGSMAATACGGGGSCGWRQRAAMVEAAVAVTAAWLWRRKRNSAVVVAAAAPAPAISCRQGEFNNQQGQEVATEGNGVGTDRRTMMVIWDGRREAVRVGRRNDRAAHVQQRDQGQRRQ